MKVYFVIPAFNEAANLPRLTKSIHSSMKTLGLDYLITLVDDGSTDDTAQIARSSGVTINVLSQPNQGPGAAFRNGFRHALALARDEDTIVTLEADNTSDLSILPAMLAALNHHRHDVVLASVYGPGGQIVGASLLRKVLSWGANQLLVSVLGTRNLHTYSSFFRAYRPTILRQAQIAYGDQLLSESGFVCMVELLIQLLQIGCRFTEVPMVLDSAQRVGASKMKVVRTIRAYGRVLWRYKRGDFNILQPSVAAASTAGNRS